MNSKRKYYATPPSRLREGFTLIETLIVIVIVIILSAVAIPSFRNMIVSQRLQSVAFQIVQDLRETRENAILYQQDLNIYFNYDNSPVEYLSGTNFNNRQYCFETFLKDPLATPVDHYIPTDSANSHFRKKILSYHIVISNITSNTNSSIAFDGKNYFVIAFRSGAGDTFRGEANIVKNMETNASGEKRVVSDSDYESIGATPVIIELKDVPTGKTFYIRISATGKISMYGQPQPY
jgi:prepilin-type N-terminal cleavage/methylation domain-containing protein